MSQKTHSPEGHAEEVFGVSLSAQAPLSPESVNALLQDAKSHLDARDPRAAVDAIAAAYDVMSDQQLQLARLRDTTLSELTACGQQHRGPHPQAVRLMRRTSGLPRSARQA